MNEKTEKIEKQVQASAPMLAKIVEEVGKIIIGQKPMIERLLIDLLSDGHILVEGVPGLAKTTAVKILATSINAEFKRIQFTPDLLPSDIIGTQIYNPKDSSFSVKKGPVFANFILADEINRAPAKVQSALLEAMQERQITIGDQTFKLPVPFLVMATQNPIEQEGTYPLPEAELDRFLMKIKVEYPTQDEEIKIIKQMEKSELPKTNPVIDPQQIINIRNIVNSIYMDDKLCKYITDIVFATRDPEKFKLKDMKPLIQYGASPRASIYLARTAKAHAFLQGRGYVTPLDIKTVSPDVLRHRIIVSYEAEA
ncbi:MAG: ATPase, partial [Deltaproteobacteria bacterium CG07_land_8_20_14_0_80_38_7]